MYAVRNRLYVHMRRRTQNGSCSGTAGCCEADLPSGVRYYRDFFNELYNTTKIWRKTPCNYITVMESAAFNFSTTYLTSTAFYDADDSRTPVVMEWGIARQTCEEAKANETAYACVSDHSDCVYSDAAGYRCRCSSGFEGNPYIVDGCTGSFLPLAQGRPLFVIHVFSFSCSDFKRCNLLCDFIRY